ncbi:MAG: hypothetical protein H7125_04925 [Proteobacteria bacterium]|nr:hypothetical protein [Burkholderiales bacterium]
MRTTLDIDDDVLAAARDLSRRQRIPLGRVVSALVRTALTTSPAALDAMPGSTPVAGEPSSFYGFRPLPRVADLFVTNAQIDRLRAIDGI